jgi:hypothetical protein
MIAWSRAVSMYCWKLLILPSLTFQTWQTWVHVPPGRLVDTLVAAFHDYRVGRLMELAGEMVQPSHSPLARLKKFSATAFGPIQILALRRVGMPLRQAPLDPGIEQGHWPKCRSHGRRQSGHRCCSPRMQERGGSGWHAGGRLVLVPSGRALMRLRDARFSTSSDAASVAGGCRCSVSSEAAVAAPVKTAPRAAVSSRRVLPGRGCLPATSADALR